MSVDVEDFVDAPKTYVDSIDPSMLGVWQVNRADVPKNCFHYEDQKRYQLKIILVRGKGTFSLYFSYHPKGYGKNKYASEQDAITALQKVNYDVCLEHNIVRNNVLFVEDSGLMLVTLTVGANFSIHKDTVMLLDWSDYQIIDGQTVSILKSKHTNYARLIMPENDDGTFDTPRVHRLMFSEIKDDELVDHINRNGLDNRRENLTPGAAQGNLKNVSSRVETFDKNPISGIALKQQGKRNPYWKVTNTNDDSTKDITIYNPVKYGGMDAALVEALRVRIAHLKATNNVNGFEVGWGVTRDTIEETSEDYIIEKVLERHNAYKISHNIQELEVRYTKASTKQNAWQVDVNSTPTDEVVEATGHLLRYRGATAASAP